jgi:2-amino-4-hydroxy-6-hydroxymethyldihydropteridine diphosphokinase
LGSALELSQGAFSEARVILIGIGSNLPTSAYGPPRETAKAAVTALEKAGVRVLRQSRWYETAPVPVSDQPWYVNGVVEVATDLEPYPLLQVLHSIEADFDRVRTVRNAARTLDLDLLDYDGRVSGEETGVILPHPRLHQRAFVLKPLMELAPGWRHPVTGKALDELIRALPPEQAAHAIGPDRP